MESITMVEYITETYGLKNTLRLVSYALLGASFGILIAIETNSTNKKENEEDEQKTNKICSGICYFDWYHNSYSFELYKVTKRRIPMKKLMIGMAICAVFGVKNVVRMMVYPIIGAGVGALCAVSEACIVG